ncbi:MAG: ParA family protein [Oscillibacter sp.]|nr:ParA family protein [Oscillibacter sp.]
MAKTVAIVNQKGGVGKTTTCVNLAAALHEAGQRVLLCDFDPQANATSGMGVDKSVSKGVYNVMIEGLPPAEAVVRTRFGDVLPSNKALAGAGIELIGMERREFLLRDALAQLAPAYDFLFIDCPPSLELLTLNALCAADTLLVPVQGEYFALEGLSDLMNTVRLVRRSLNPRLELEGVLLTMFDGRTNLALQVAEEVKHYFPGKVYATVIPRNVRLSEAPSHGKPITAYDRTCRGAAAYTALASEFLNKQSV